MLRGSPCPTNIGMKTDDSWVRNLAGNIEAYIGTLTPMPPYLTEQFVPMWNPSPADVFTNPGDLVLVFHPTTHAGCVICLYSTTSENPVSIPVVELPMSLAKGVFADLGGRE